MKYTQPRFTLPAGSSKITQEQWDTAFPDAVTQRALCTLAHCKPLYDQFKGMTASEASRNSPKCNDASDCVNRDTVPS